MPGERSSSIRDRPLSSGSGRRYRCPSPNGVPVSSIDPTTERTRKEDRMANPSDQPTASAEERASALEIVLRRKGEMPGTFVEDFTDHAEEKWITENGARMVARAWVDPGFRARMLADGKAAAQEMGFEFPEHHRQLLV